MPNIIDSIQNDLEISKELYPQILAILKDFERFYDNEDNLAQEKFDFEYQNMSKKLEILTGKDMQDYMLWEWWEDEGIEVLAFRIAMPLPKIYPNFSKKELQDIVGFIIHSNFPIKDNFSENFGCYLDEYLHELLAINFPKSYCNEYFHRHKINGKYIEFLENEIIDSIFSQQSFQSQIKLLIEKYS